MSNPFTGSNKAFDKSAQVSTEDATSLADLTTREDSLFMTILPLAVEE